MPASFSAAWRDYRLLVMTGALYAAFCLGLACGAGVPGREIAVFLISSLQFVAGLAGIFLAASYGLLLLREFFRPAPGSGLGARWRGTTDRLGARLEAYVRGPLFPAACFGLVICYEINFFLVQKALIRHVHPYAWDTAFAAWDKAVHFGHYPHQVIAPLMEKAGVVGVAETAYLFWFALMYLLLGYNLFFDAQRTRRLRFLWVFTLSWFVIGGMLATVFSSVGPVFYHLFYAGPDPYPDLAAKFMGEAESPRPVMSSLLRTIADWTRGDAMLPENALSAMPSMHGAISWLFLLYARAFGHFAWWLMLVFFFAVYGACLYFGLHYAIDFYLSVAVVSILWWGAGRLIPHSNDPS